MTKWPLRLGTAPISASGHLPHHSQIVSSSHVAFLYQSEISASPRNLAHGNIQRPLPAPLNAQSSIVSGSSLFCPIRPNGGLTPIKPATPRDNSPPTPGYLCRAC